MSTREKARLLMVQQRQHEESVGENMLSRAVEAVETQESTDTSEKARELLAQERQEQEHLQENMLSRASEAIS